jgi:hypothetical protein
MADFDLSSMLQEQPLRFGARSTTGWDYFDYAPEQPNLYMLMRFKQLLVREYGIEAGFEIYRRTISKQRSVALATRRLESHYDYSKACGTFFHEAIAAGEPFCILPPRVIGEGNHRQISNVTRSLYISCIENACVRGRSSIIETADLVLADFQGDELARIDDEVEFDSAIFNRDGNRVHVISVDRAACRFEAALSLLGCRTDFFGDWLSDSITRYVGATFEGRLPSVPVLIDAGMPKTHRQALELMLLPGTAIVEIPAFQPVHVRHLWWPVGIGYVPFHQKLNERFKWDYVMCSPQRFLPIRKEMVRRADLVLGDARGPSRVFLARRSFRHRKLVNHEEIEAIAEQYGFAICYPEDLDFAEQARLLRGARFVVAPEGSALFLTYFLGGGGKLCILNHAETHALVGYNGGAEDNQVTIIAGPEAGTRRGRSQDMDYSIDADVFRCFLDGWLEADQR